ncbi:metallophosphoesterase family protein [Roseomonas sp. CCTCC AB2023176]|uniref:metallophosphoesterase family protein n=1 Tax=Roseomonas sp. CCTCC AB2023176 TaxID=3342640 RepID=UPI0035D7EAF7
MRIAAIADVHGNLLALEAVLDDLAGFAPDLVVNLGDTVSGPLQAAETADLLMARSFPTVRGNHDRHLIHPPAKGMGASDRAAHAGLAPHHLAWLAALPATLRPVPEVLCLHGCPDDDTELLLDDAARKRGLVRASAQDIAERLGDPGGATLVLCGHSHRPDAVALPGGPLVVNPGSVGLQGFEDDEPFPYRFSAGTPHARYALLDRTPRGWAATWRALTYDWDAAAEVARLAGRKEWASALATGFP